ncbi:MAG: CoA-transferase, partial [Actinomycetota bacterium]
SSIFVTTVDMVSGVGYDRARAIGGFIAKRHDLRRVITNMAVLDFGGPDHTMRLVSVHPGVTVDEVVANTGFALELPNEVPTSREPNEAEAAAIALLDPRGLRHRELPT